MGTEECAHNKNLHNIADNKFHCMSIPNSFWSKLLIQSGMLLILYADNCNYQNLNIHCLVKINTKLSYNETSITNEPNCRIKMMSAL